MTSFYLWDKWLPRRSERAGPFADDSQGKQVDRFLVVVELGGKTR